MAQEGRAVGDKFDKMRIWLGSAVVLVYLGGSAYSAFPGVTWRPDPYLAWLAGGVIAALFGGPITRWWRGGGRNGSNGS